MLQRRANQIASGNRGMSKKTILLNGPAFNTKDASYGGGKGGAERNMALYLNGFSSEDHELEPCFYSVRQKGAGRLSFVKRLVGDTREVLRKGRSAAGIHILAQYRTAIYREFSVVLASLILRLPILYHIKAGIFVDWLKSCRYWEKKMALFILARADVILCEGQVYVDYLRSELRIESHYFPNFVPEGEIPTNVGSKLTEDKIRVLFVGFCYEGKGVFELVEGCQMAATGGMRVELTLVGQEHEYFTRFLDSQNASGLSITVNRMGTMEHDEVLALYETHDVFCMPTRHRGEGHTNTINEAMMMGMVIVSTRHGFLERVLADNSSFFLDDLTPTDIAKTLKTIHIDRDEARQRAKRARTRLMSCFTSNTAFSNLSAHYRTLTHEGQSSN